MFSDGRALTHLVVVARLDAHWDLTLEKQNKTRRRFNLGTVKKQNKPTHRFISVGWKNHVTKDCNKSRCEHGWPLTSGQGSTWQSLIAQCPSSGQKGHGRLRFTWMEGGGGRHFLKCPKSKSNWIHVHTKQLDLVHKARLIVGGSANRLLCVDIKWSRPQRRWRR